MGAKNQLPVSLQDIWFPTLRSATTILTFKFPQKADRDEVVQGPARSAVKPPKLLPFGTKMSLSLVFAPAQSVEEMAEALPVCLRRKEGDLTTVCNLLGLKQAQQFIYLFIF